MFDCLVGGGIWVGQGEKRRQKKEGARVGGKRIYKCYIVEASAHANANAHLGSSEGVADA